MKKKATGNQEHKPEGTTITYDRRSPGVRPALAGHRRRSSGSSTPPSDRPQVEYVVHNLEHGYSLLWYDDTIAEDSDQLAVVKAIAKKYEGTKLTDKFIALPWTSEGRQGLPEGHARRADPLVRRRRPDRRLQAAGRLAVLRQAQRRGRRRSSSRTTPTRDSPEPQAM